MTRHSLPIRRFDGSVIIEPLRLNPAYRHHGGTRRPERHKPDVIGDTRVQRAKILRDLAILALLAITIVAGSAVLIGTLWRDVAVAESEARIVEAEQAAQVRLAEAEILATSEKKAGQEMLVIVLIGFGIAIIALALARPSIIIGR